MYGFQITQIVVVHIDAYAKVEARITSVHNFEISELQKNIHRNRLESCKLKRHIESRPIIPDHRSRKKSMKFKVKLFEREKPIVTSTKLVCFASRTVTTACTSSISFCFSSSSKFMYHLARRVLPARFCINMKRI